MKLPGDWAAALEPELDPACLEALETRLSDERARHTIYPPEGELFTALELTPRERVSVVILGQDPYHDVGQAHGLAFSVRRGCKLPPSLRNLLKELESDIPSPLGAQPCQHGDLSEWAQQGVLLLNTVLTVRAHEPTSHKALGWQPLTDAIVRSVTGLQHVVFLLLGAHAHGKARWIGEPHTVLKLAHPSPLSARRFFGSRPFSAINDALKAHGQPPIDWHRSA